MRRRRTVRKGKLRGTVEWNYKPTSRQRKFHTEPTRFKLYGGAVGGGKLISLNTEIPTPYGWSTMGELQVGDQVFDETGSPCNVVWKSEVESETTYRVVFSDGSSVIAGARHQWVTTTDRERSRKRKCTPEFRAWRRAIRPKRGKGIKPWLAERNSKNAKTGDLPLFGIRTTEEKSFSVRFRE